MASADPVEMYLNDVFTVTVNMAGLPGLVTPAGLSADGLPLGLQLIGRPFDEETLFAIGATIEEAAGSAFPAGAVVGVSRETRRHPLRDDEVIDMTTAPANAKLIKGATGDWEIVIGLEVHAQVTSRAKLFSGASTEFGGEPNAHVSLVDAAMPGMLPVINRECVAQAVRTGLALKAQINKRSTFDRKNYFYPDLPQGYQISQYKSPIVGEGEIQVDLTPDYSIRVGIERLHLEQDAGKSLHDQSPTMSFVDLNRSGVALMEIVSKPDLRSADEAKAYVGKLRTILRYIGSCDGDMEKGSLRADVNVSVRRPGEPLGTRCEIKNVNSIRFIGQAIETEARRQIEIIEDGGTIDQETRLFDPARGETRSMRSKEEAHDYRYFPDPDLLPLEFDDEWVDALAAYLPELPDAKKARFIADYGLSAYDASVIVAERETADFFESAVNHGGRKARRQGRRQLADGRSLGAGQRTGRQRRRTPAFTAASLADARRPDRRRRDLRQDRQGPSRHAARRRPRRRSARARRSARPASGDRHRRDRRRGRRGHRRQSRQGRAGQGEARHARLVRRPGDEDDRRQGQSAGGQRRVEETTRALSRERIARCDSRDSLASQRVARGVCVAVATEMRQRLPRKIRLTHARSRPRGETRAALRTALLAPRRCAHDARRGASRVPRRFPEIARKTRADRGSANARAFSTARRGGASPALTRTCVDPLRVSPQPPLRRCAARDNSIVTLHRSAAAGFA